MKPIANIITALALLVTAASVITCNNDKKVKAETKNDRLAANSQDTLIYNFIDASVPPQFHRSYTIRVIPGQVFFTIDVYGKIISQDSLVLTRSAYDSFATAINDLHIRNKKDENGKPCTGGTSDKLDLYAGSSREVKGYIYYCGGGKNGDLEGDITAAANLFKALIPDLSGRLDATRNDN